MPVIIPAPPGEAVAFDDSRPARRAERSTRNLFAIGQFDRGTVAQFADVSGLRAAMGPRQNTSVASDEVAVALAEGGGTVTASRAVGPAAVAASVVIDGKVRITAASPGAWGNNLTAVFQTPGSGMRRLAVYESGALVVTSPAFAATADLIAWAATVPLPIVNVAIVTSGLPASGGSPVALVGGTDDASNLGLDGWKAALAALDRRYGPGILIAPGVTDVAVQGAIIDHLAATNRIAHLQLPLDVTEAQAAAQRASLAADHPDDHWRVGLWGSWMYASPVGGEADRLVGYAAAQAGIASFVERQYGIGVAPFGPDKGVSTTARRLTKEWDTGFSPPGAVQRLYASYVNVAQDNGADIFSKGFRTLDASQLRSDLHVAGTRMRLAWGAEQEAEAQGGKAGDKTTLAEYHAALVGLCKEFADARAFNTDQDEGYRVDTESVNDRDSLARREVHARIYFRPNGSTDWTDVLVGSRLPSEQI